MMTEQDFIDRIKDHILSVIKAYQPSGKETQSRAQLLKGVKNRNSIRILKHTFNHFNESLQLLNKEELAKIINNLDEDLIEYYYTETGILLTYKGLPFLQIEEVTNNEN
jgi:hypothetical protein